MGGPGSVFVVGPGAVPGPMSLSSVFCVSASVGRCLAINAPASFDYGVASSSLTHCHLGYFVLRCVAVAAGIGGRNSLRTPSNLSGTFTRSTGGTSSQDV